MMEDTNNTRFHKRHRLISPKEFLDGVNFQESITYSSIKKMMNSNAQFIIDLATSERM